jgi:hypothetical protein
MKWSNIFTLPDPTIVQEGSVDPLGMQVIWTHFGQSIFENKLTTVATDIRNYTANLLHHLVVYELQTKHSEVFEQAKHTFPAYANDYDLKAGLLILLEDIFVFSLMHNKHRSEVDTHGLLGSHKAEIEMLSDPQTVWIEAEKTKGILVRQLQLGMIGRYKGPYINMGMLTRTLQYTERWVEIETVVSQWPDGNQLVNALVEWLVSLLEHKTGAFIQVTLAEFLSQEKLVELYIASLGKTSVHPALREFWESNLGLDKGAAKAIYQQVGSLGLSVHPRVILLKSIEQTKGENAQKIDRILRLEPFLSGVSQIFYLLTDLSNKHLRDLTEQISQLAEHLKLDDIIDLCQESPRLKTLFTHIKEAGKDPERLAQKIIEYHAFVMQLRGGGAWIEIQENKLKHYIAQKTQYSTEDFLRDGIWYHDYYLSSVGSIYKGLNPN